MKLRKRSESELAVLAVEYTAKAARALAVVQDVQRELARREKVRGAFYEGQAKGEPWPREFCATCKKGEPCQLHPKPAGGAAK